MPLKCHYAPMSLDAYILKLSPNAPSGAEALPELGAYLGFLLLIILT